METSRLWGFGLGESSRGRWLNWAAVLLYPSIALAAAAIAVSACSSSGIDPGSPSVFLDEAFEAARPGLAAELKAGAGSGKYASISLDDGPSLLLEKAKAAGYKAGGPARALVTSPLLAIALASGEEELRSLDRGQAPGPGGGGIGALGESRLIVPDYRGGARDSILGIGSDSLKAYASAGSACGAYIASPASGGRAGAIIYRAGRAEDEAGAETFIEAFRTEAGAPPIVERLEAPEGGEIDEEAGVGRLLERDLALVLVGPGLRLDLVLPRIARPGLALGLVFDDLPPELPLEQGPTFWITADIQGLAREVLAAARDGGKGTETIPALLLYDSRAFPALGAYLGGRGAKKSIFSKIGASRR